MKNAARRTRAVPDIDELLCFAVYSAGHAFNRVYKPLLDSLELTYPQYLVMVALWANDDQTVGALGAKMFLESSTLTPLLKRLEGMGRIERRRDPEDERQVRVRLTEAGAALEARAGDFRACVLDASGLSVTSLKKLQAEIVTLRDRLLETTTK